MTILIVVIFLMVFFSYISQVKNELKTEKIDVYCLATIVTYTLFVGLRTGYNDTAAYIRAFENMEPFSEFLVNSERMHLLHNPLFYGIVSVVRGYTENYHVFFMVVAAINSVLLVRFIKKYCCGYFAYAIFLFWGYGLGMFGLAAMKQITAMAILTLAIDAMNEKKWMKFLVIVLIASLIHTYAILFITLPLFQTKPWKLNTFILVAMTMTIMATFNTTITTFLDYADEAGKSVADFEVFDGVQMNIFRVLIFAIVPVLILVFKRRLIPKMTRSQYLLSNMSIISLMFMLMARVNGANMFGRLATYFVLGNICMLGWILEQIFEEKSKKILIMFSIMFFSIFILYDNLDFATTSGYGTITLLEFIGGLL